MQRKLVILIVAVVAGGAFAQPCPEQAFLKLDEVDPNQIATDPASGELLLFSYVRVPCPGAVTFNGIICWEKVAGPVTATISGAGIDPNTPLAVDPNSGDFAFSTQSTTATIQYFTVRVEQADMPPREGTVAIAFYEPQPATLIGRRVDWEPLP